MHKGMSRRHYFTFHSASYAKLNPYSSLFFPLLYYSISQLNFGLNHQSVFLINPSHLSRPITNLCTLFVDVHLQP